MIFSLSKAILFFKNSIQILLPGAEALIQVRGEVVVDGVNLLQPAKKVARAGGNLVRSGTGLALGIGYAGADLAQTVTSDVAGKAATATMGAAKVARRATIGAADTTIGTVNWAAKGARTVGNGATAVAMDVAGRAVKGVRAIGSGLTNILFNGPQLMGNLLSSSSYNKPSHEPYEEHKDIKLRDHRGSRSNQHDGKWEDIETYGSTDGNRARRFSGSHVGSGSHDGAFRISGGFGIGARSPESRGNFPINQSNRQQGSGSSTVKRPLTRRRSV